MYTLLLKAAANTTKSILIQMRTLFSPARINGIISKLFFYKYFPRFDQAMVAFLDCLQQLEEEVERGDTTFCLPYKMANGKIEDKSNGASYSIR